MHVSRWKMPVAAMAFLLLICGGFVFAAAEEAKQEAVEEQEELFQRAVETAVAHMEKSRLYYKKKDKGKALKELKKIIRIDFPEGMEGREEYTVVYYSYVNAGKLLMELEKPKEARLLVDEGVKKVPEPSAWAHDLYMTQGKIFEKLDMAEEAIRSFDKALEITKKLEKAQKKKMATKAKQAAQAAEAEEEQKEEEKENDEDE